jgi:hypothetical protein
MSYEPLKITDATYEKQNKKMRSKHKSETGKTLGKRLTSGVDPRRVSFACRFAGMKGPMKDANGKPTKKAMALKKWGFGSVGAAAKFCHANKGKSPNKLKDQYDYIQQGQAIKEKQMEIDAKQNKIDRQNQKNGSFIINLGGK